MGCAASSEAREARAANPTQPAPCVWLRILRLDNVPDSDASPFKHGDYYCKPVLETQGASLEGACLTSSYGRGHFQPVSARENVKFDRMVRFSLPHAWGDLDAARLVCKIFDKDVLTADDLIGVRGCAYGCVCRYVWMCAWMYAVCVCACACVCVCVCV